MNAFSFCYELKNGNAIYDCFISEYSQSGYTLFFFCFFTSSLFWGNMGGKVSVPPAKFKEKPGVPMNMFGPHQCIANLSWMDDQSDMYIPGASKIPQC